MSRPGMVETPCLQAKKRLSMSPKGTTMELRQILNDLGLGDRVRVERRNSVRDNQLG